MGNLVKLMVKAGLLKMPVVRQVTLRDSDLVRLDGVGNFYLVRDGHFYRVTEKFSDIVEKSESVCLKYVGESRKIDKKYINKFKSFEKFKEDYNYIKKGMGEK